MKKPSGTASDGGRISLQGFCQGGRESTTALIRTYRFSSQNVECKDRQKREEGARMGAQRRAPNCPARPRISAERTVCSAPKAGHSRPFRLNIHCLGLHLICQSETLRRWQCRCATALRSVDACRLHSFPSKKKFLQKPRYRVYRRGDFRCSCQNHTTACTVRNDFRCY